MTHPKGLILAAMIGATISLLGCGIGGGGGGGGGAATASGGTTIHGTAVKGPVSGAVLSAFAMSATGAKSGAALATATADAHGNFAINVGAHTGPLLIECTGGTYTDETTGLPVTLSATKNLLLALPKAEAVTAPVAITPLTSMALGLAKTQAAAQGLATAIANANAQIGASSASPISSPPSLSTSRAPRRPREAPPRPTSMRWCSLVSVSRPSALTRLGSTWHRRSPTTSRTAI